MIRLTKPKESEELMAYVIEFQVTCCRCSKFRRVSESAPVDSTTVEVPWAPFAGEFETDGLGGYMCKECRTKEPPMPPREVPQRLNDWRMAHGMEPIT